MRVTPTTRGEAVQPLDPRPHRSERKRCALAGPSAKDVKLVAKGLDGAVLTITGNVAPARSRLVAKLTGLPLAPFNPYAASSG